MTLRHNIENTWLSNIEAHPRSFRINGLTREYLQNIQIAGVRTSFQRTRCPERLSHPIARANDQDRHPLDPYTAHDPRRIAPVLRIARCDRPSHEKSAARCDEGNLLVSIWNGEVRLLTHRVQ